MRIMLKVMKILRLLLAVGQVLAPFVKDPTIVDIDYDKGKDIVV